MARRVASFAGLAALVLAGVIASVPSVWGAEGSGTFVVISDLHFNPFDPPALATTLARSAPAAWRATFAAARDQAMSPTGEDTNHALLVSSLVPFAKAVAGADFAIVPGDFLVHEFDAKAAQALGVAPASQAVGDMAVKTTLFVGDALADALAGKPAIVALGNVDSSCGDYRIEPGGRYLAETREMVRRLVGAERLEADFEQTYATGGYYAARHPTLANGLIVVLNDVLWSAKYRDACGTDGLAAAQAMLDWFRDRLARQRATGGRVWLVHHIPWGIDPYSTIVNTQASTCPAKVVPFLREPFASDFPALLAEYHEVLQASFSGHTHFDDYRLLIDGHGTAVAMDKLVPGISPVFGQDPGFQVFTYDRRSGVPGDFSTWYLANPGAAPSAADWRFEYTFTTAYRQPHYAPDAVKAVWQALAADGAVRDTYRRLYNVGRGALAGPLTAYACAIGHLDRASFTACYCR